jgi:hypothetical protein
MPRTAANKIIVSLTVATGEGTCPLYAAFSRPIIVLASKTGHLAKRPIVSNLFNYTNGSWIMNSEKL